MNYATIIIETLLMTIAFTAMILVPLIKNPVWWIHDFPADIQEEYFKTHERIPTAFFSKTTLLKKGFAIVLVIAFFMFLIWLSGAYSFLSAFAVSYGIWTFIMPAIELFSIWWSLVTLPVWLQWGGVVIAAIGVWFFIASILTMKGNWRAGVPDKKETSLVTTGIYSISRNPAFVGFLGVKRII